MATSVLCGWRWNGSPSGRTTSGRGVRTGSGDSRRPFGDRKILSRVTRWGSREGGRTLPLNRRLRRWTVVRYRHRSDESYRRRWSGLETSEGVVTSYRSEGSDVLLFPSQLGKMSTSLSGVSSHVTEMTTGSGDDRLGSRVRTVEGLADHSTDCVSRVSYRVLSRRRRSEPSSTG